MNVRPGELKEVGPTSLAGVPDFLLGPIEVSPSSREIRFGHMRETVQPRVMQVLVALVRAQGSVVSRDDLIRECWGGRIVGEDAINRSIAKVRALGELAGERAFEIETIPRIGYRLKPCAARLPARPASIENPTMPVPGHLVPEAPSRRRASWKWAGSGIAALAAGAALTWMLWPAAPDQWRVAHSEILIGTTLIERHPAISPDGRMIAYSAGTNILSRQIYLSRITGGDKLRLTDDSYDDVSPAWSPDGGRIAYVAYKEGEPCRLMVTPFPAGSPQELGRCQSDERSHVVWSASGKDLFFLDAPDTKSVDRIMRLDLATGRRSQVTHPAARSLGDDEPVVSPDGRWLTFLRHNSQLNAQRMILDLRSGDIREGADASDDYGAAWSEDSQTLFTDRNDGHDFSLWTSPLNGGPATRILSSPDTLGRLSSGPNGLLAVEIGRVSVGVARSPVSADGGAIFLESETGKAGSPDIAPDGTIAVEIDRPGDSGLWLLPPKGAMRKLVGLDGDELDGEARWSPDGSRIAFQTKVGASPGIRVIAGTGANVMTVSFPGSSIGTPAWSADGRVLIFPGRDARGWRLWRVHIAHPETLSPMSDTGWVNVRTRNDALYGVRSDVSGVWRIDGIPRRITAKPAPDRANEWAIVGNEIAYVDEPSGERRQILAQSIGGGPVRVMAQVPHYCMVAGFAVNPANGAVIYSATFGFDDDIELLHLARR